MQSIASLKIEPKPDAQNCVNALTFVFRYDKWRHQIIWDLQCVIKHIATPILIIEV